MSVKSKKKEKKPVNKVLRVFIIVKNVIFIVFLVLILGLLAITLTAHFNGETPKLFGHAVYRVVSGSMHPVLEKGDIILCRDCDPMELKAGDIITYDGRSGDFAGKRVTHRVVKEPYLNEANGKYYLVTKGDDNPAEDTPITTDQVTGKYVKKLDWLQRLYDFFLTPWGLLTLIGLIVLAFFNEIVNFARALGGDDDEEEHEDIQEIIARVQRESAEEEKRELEKAQKKQLKKRKKSRDDDGAEEAAEGEEIESAEESGEADDVEASEESEVNVAEPVDENDGADDIEE